MHNENIVRCFSGDPDDHYVHNGCCRNTHGRSMTNTRISEATLLQSQGDPEADGLTWEGIVDIRFSVMPDHEGFRGGRL